MEGEFQRPHDDMKTHRKLNLESSALKKFAESLGLMLE